MRPTRDERGVSITINYVLSLAIATLLITGLVFAAGSFMEDRREQATRTELRVIGQQLAADLTGADRLVRASDGGGTVTIERSIPEDVVGSTYNVEIRQLGGRQHEITLRSGNDIAVTVEFTTETPVQTSRVDGGSVEISYNGAALEVDDV